MRLFLPCLGLLFLGIPAIAQTPADTTQRWHSDEVAFTWPMPFTHVPQRFVQQATRFTAPYEAPMLSQLYALDVLAWPSTASADDFNDTLRVRFLGATPDGVPDRNHPLGDSLDFFLAELVPGTTTPLNVSEAGVVLSSGVHVWVSLELLADGNPDTLVLVSGPAEATPLDRTAAFVEGEGWKLMRDTQFAPNDYTFHIAAHFRAITGQADEAPAETAAGYALTGFFPNPFTRRATLRYRLPQDAPVRAWLFDVTGRQVWQADWGYHPSGAHQQVVDVAVPPGLYLLQVQADDQQMRRTVVVR